MNQLQQGWPLQRAATVLFAAMALVLFGLAAGACQAATGRAAAPHR